MTKNRYIVQARGGRCRDDSGNEYVDWICGYGPVVLGHGDQRVVDAVTSRLSKGSLLPGMSRDREELVSQIIELFPHTDGCIFTKTASEAVTAAIRIARAITERTLILRIGFNGWHNELIESNVSWHNFDNIHNPEVPIAGIPTEHKATREIFIGRFVDEIPKSIHELGERLAAVVLDPVQIDCNIGAHLAMISEACRRVGALFILDETKTAFRVHPGGVQGLYRVCADITVAGKAMANGLPIAAVVTTTELLRLQKVLKIKGTFSEELAAIAAANATLNVIRKDDVCGAISAIGTSLISELNEVLTNEGLGEIVKAVPYRWPSLPHLHSPSNSPDALQIRSRLIELMAANGALLLDGHNCFVCASHSKDDLGLTRQATQVAARQVVSELGYVERSG